MLATLRVLCGSELARDCRQQAASYSKSRQQVASHRVRDSCPQKTMAPCGAIERRSGRPWGRRAYSALRTPALASRPVQDLPASPLYFMAALVPTQVPQSKVCTAWLLPRSARKLSPEKGPVTIPHSWRVCTEMQKSGASSLPQWVLLFVGSELPPTMGGAICRERAPSHKGMAAFQPSGIGSARKRMPSAAATRAMVMKLGLFSPDSAR